MLMVRYTSVIHFRLGGTTPLTTFVRGLLCYARIFGIPVRGPTQSTRFCPSTILQWYNIWMICYLFRTCPTHVLSI